jgi:NADH:ubiquinone oxidoreductase subunit F (NADH-binding)
MVNVARFFLEFTQDESCGKCTPCRVGTQAMLEFLTRITKARERRETSNASAAGGNGQ